MSLLHPLEPSETLDPDMIQQVTSGNDNLISSIPPDLLFEIALELPYSQVLRLCRVSHRFNQLFCVEDYGHIWRALYRRDISAVRVPNHVTATTEKQILQTFERIPFRKTRFIEAVRHGYDRLAQHYLESIDPSRRPLVISEAVEWATRPGYDDLYHWLMSLRPKHLSYALKGAVLNHRDDLIEALLPKLNHRVSSGIFNAAKTGQIDLLNRFLTLNPGVSSSSLAIAIRGAASGNQRDLLESLLARYPNPNDPHLLSGALYGAARGGHQGLVDELLNRGAIAHTAFTGAAVGGHFNLLRDLFERGLNQGQIDVLDEYILQGASEGGHLDIINYMLDLVDFTPEAIETALTAAAKNGHGEIVRRLLDENPINIDPAIVAARARGYSELADYLETWQQHHPQPQPEPQPQPQPQPE
jgi:hypothetical protein